MENKQPKPKSALRPWLGLLGAFALSANLRIIVLFHQSAAKVTNERKLSEPELNESFMGQAKPWPKPDGWTKLGFYDIRKHFSCKEYAHDQTKPLPTMEGE